MQLRLTRPGVLTAAADALDLVVQQLVFFCARRIYIIVTGMLPVAGKAGAIHARVRAHNAMQTEIAVLKSTVSRSAMAVVSVG